MIVHGDARRANHAPEYDVWCAMKRRCNSRNARDFPYYNGRGIAVCQRWQKYENFIADMGRRPTPDHMLERVDNNSGYSPDNCVWATRSVQMRNRRTPPPQTHCKRGHPLSGDNLHIRPNGARFCRACNRMRMRKIRAERGSNVYR